MILSKDEAICLVLGMAKENIITSPTKLNKLLARLNLFFIPIDIKFTLNKYGSYNSELASIETGKYFKLDPYEAYGKKTNKYILDSEGMDLYQKVISSKISKILDTSEIEKLKNTISELSALPATDISGDEHKKLLVDVEDRHKLIHRINSVFVDLSDLYQESHNIPEESIVEIRLKALIEYSFHLSKFLKEKRFKRVGSQEYDSEAEMFDYYFLYNMEKIIPFLTVQIKSNIKDNLNINKYYQFILNSVKDYPFSLQNKDLKNLICS